MKLTKNSSVVVISMSLFFSFWILEKITKTDATKQVQPKLNVTDTSVDVQLNSTLCLQCSGPQPLSWGFKDPRNRNKRYQDVGTVLNVTQNEERFDSTICIFFTSYLQTGDYVCYCDNLSTSLYVFVNDDAQLLLPLHNLKFLTLHEGTRSVIPCLPTISKTNVTLWKVKPPDAERIELDRYDPTVGFILRNPMTSFKGNFYCMAQYLDKTQRLTAMNIDVLPQTQSIPEVSIDESHARYVLLHSNFSLKCIVKIKLGTISSPPRWSHPVNDGNRVLESYPTIKKNRIHKIITQTLTVINAQKTDEGAYQCNVTDHSDRENYSQVEVRIYENPQVPAVNFSKGFDTLVRGRGEHVELRAPYTVFPFTSDIQSMWTKDGGQLPPTPRKYVIKPTDSDFTLEISNLTRLDSGTYTVTAHTPGGAFNTSFNLRVRDTPLVTIENSASCCFIPGRSYQLHCVSKGFPTPSSSWSWIPIQDCFDSSCDDWRSVDEALDVNDSTQWFMDVDEETVWSILNVTAKTSGYYRCSGKNELGIAKEEVQFIVSDIPNGFDIEVEDIFPLEMTLFSMTCKVNSDLFLDLQWKWMPQNDNESIFIPDEFLNKSNTSNSIELELKLEDIRKNNSGTYTCLAFTKNPEIIKKKSMFLLVRGIQGPRFVHLNWSTEMLSSPNSVLEIECSVEGTPTPKVTWYRNGTPLTSNLTGGRFENDFQKLVIGRVVEGDHGDYACVAENVAGVIMRNVSLSITTGGVPVPMKGNTSQSRQIWNLVAVGVGAASLLIFLLLFGRWFYRRKYTLMKLQGFDHQLFQEGRISIYDPNMPLDDQADLLPYDKKWEFPKENLKFGRTLGQGAFGRVVKAEAFGLNDYEISTTVAVKMLKERADISQQKALAAELKILIHLGHQVNIVNLMGAVTKNISQGELLVMVEYCRYGNLRNYLLQHRNIFVNDIELYSRNPVQFLAESSTLGSSDTGITEIRSDSFMSSSGSGSAVFAVDNPNYRQRLESISNANAKVALGKGRSMSCSSGSSSRYYCRVDSHEHVIATSDLLCYAFQSACGMAYLAYKKLIHRDLAARNVLLADDKVVKICDFGLAKDCYKYENYIKKGDGPLPIKWMAIESIRDHVFTTKSDVWSFGILMWEFFTLGSNPYPGIEIDEEFYKRLSTGYRMEKPDFCPEDAYQIMRDCWEANPDDRPNFNELSDILGGLLEPGLKQHYIDLNEPYLEMNCKLQTHDYSNMPIEDESPTRVYMNSGATTPLYDNVPPVSRSIFDVPATVVEASTIQLETIEENNELKRINLYPQDSYRPEYLRMGETNMIETDL